MASRFYPNTGYSLSQSPLTQIPSPAIVAKRAPTSSDLGFALGSIWVEPVDTTGTAQNKAWILTSIIGNSANWASIEAAGGPGIFSTLSSSGNTTLATGAGTTSTFSSGANSTLTLGNNSGTTAVNIVSGTGNVSISSTGITSSAVLIQATAAAGGVDIEAGTNGILLNSVDGIIALRSGTAAINVGTDAFAKTITIGNVTGATAVDINVGTGNFTLDGVGASTYAIGASATTGTITLGGALQTGLMTLGQSTAGQNINIGNAANTGVQTIRIASGNSAANSTVSILDGVATAGTQTFSVLTGLLSTPGVVNIATGTAAHVVTIGSKTGAAATTIQSGTANIHLDSAGHNVSVTPATDSQASPSAASTVNARVGSVTFTGFTTAAAATQAFTITNSTVLATSAIFVTVTNVHNVNDAQMQLESVVIAAAGGSFVVNTKNVGAGALDGNCIINFWVIS